MRVIQPRLFADAQPLVERLGRHFFRRLPERPGVYLMHGRSATVLYVGKAKNLRKRVCSYRVANPERMARRTLRLLRLVENISWEECDNEGSALRRESELLLALKPRFNRAGVWRGPDRYLAWRCEGERLELAITEAPESGWEALGPMGSQATHLRATLLRLLWFAAHPDQGIAGMPVGWAEGRTGSRTSVPLGTWMESASGALEALRAGKPIVLCEWIRQRMTDTLHPFVKSAVNADLELLTDLKIGLRPNGQPTSPP